MKRYLNAALTYAVLAMAGGVFYREFTKFNGFDGRTALGVVHTHYFMLGMVFFLLLLVLEKTFSFTGAKTGRVLAVYHVGLNLTAVMLGGARRDPGAGGRTFLRHERGDLRHGRHRPYPAGGQPGAAAPADQAQPCRSEVLTLPGGAVPGRPVIRRNLPVPMAGQH